MEAPPAMTPRKHRSWLSWCTNAAVMLFALVLGVLARAKVNSLLAGQWGSPLRSLPTSSSGMLFACSSIGVLVWASGKQKHAEPHEAKDTSGPCATTTGKPEAEPAPQGIRDPPELPCEDCRAGRRHSSRGLKHDCLTTLANAGPDGFKHVSPSPHLNDIGSTCSSESQGRLSESAESNASEWASEHSAPTKSSGDLRTPDSDLNEPRPTPQEPEPACSSPVLLGEEDVLHHDAPPTQAKWRPRGDLDSVESTVVMQSSPGEALHLDANAQEAGGPGQDGLEQLLASCAPPPDQSMHAGQDRSFVEAMGLTRSTQVAEEEPLLHSLPRGSLWSDCLEDRRDSLDSKHQRKPILGDCAAVAVGAFGEAAGLARPGGRAAVAPSAFGESAGSAILGDCAAVAVGAFGESAGWARRDDSQTPLLAVGDEVRPRENSEGSDPDAVAPIAEAEFHQVLPMQAEPHRGLPVQAGSAESQREDLPAAPEAAVALRCPPAQPATYSSPPLTLELSAYVTWDAQHCSHRFDPSLPAAAACSTSASGVKKARRSPVNKGLPMKAMLQSLDQVDQDRVLIVRRIKKLGFSSAVALRAYFGQYGGVEQVLIANSNLLTRVRPASLGFAVLDSRAAAAAVLAAGTEHVVHGHAIIVGPFQKLDRAQSSPSGAAVEDLQFSDFS